MQDKRSVVPIEFEDVDVWLHGTQEQARTLVQLPAPELLDARASGDVRAGAPAPPLILLAGLAAATREASEKA